MQINSTNYEDISNIAEQYNLDVWGKNAIEQWIDIMIPPNQEILDVVKQHNHFVRIVDVEEHIQSIEQENNQYVSRKRQAFFDYFPNYEQILEWLNQQNALHPDITELFNVGQSYLGTTITGIKISTGAPRRAVILQAGIHAREWITVTSILYIVQQLLTTRPSALNELDFYIVPVFNVDGYSYTHTDERLWRKNREPNSGSTCIGTDLNRNYRYQWGGSGASPSPCSDTYRGATAGSSVELQVMNQWMRTVPNPLFFLDIHCCGAMFMSSWGYTYTLPPAQDYSRMDSIMQVARSALRTENDNIYSIGSIANTIYIASGNSVDDVYTNLGVLASFTVEVYGSGFVAPVSSILPLGREIYNGVYSVSDYLINSK
jgi:predicted deacylase